MRQPASLIGLSLVALCLGFQPRLADRGRMVYTALPVAPVVRAGYRHVVRDDRRASPLTMPDRGVLTSIADAHRLNHRAVLAIAWAESGSNTNPALRGHHCWYSVPPHWEYRQINKDFTQPYMDSLYVPRTAHHERDCEVGRFQIKPSTARRRCVGLDIFTYNGNMLCFFQMFWEDTQVGGTEYAIRHHNGSGPMTYLYRDRVFQTMGRLDAEGI